MAVARVPDDIEAGVDVSARRTGDLISKRLVSCSPYTDLRCAASVMVEHNVGSIVVLGADGALEGILTDNDLRRAVASGYGGPVGGIMSHPVITVGANTIAFEAIYAMLRHGIHHLVVTDEDGNPCGVLSSSDLLAAHSESPLFLAREIDRASSFGQLAAIHSRIEAMVGALAHRGASAFDLGRITAETSDRLVQRVLGLVEAELSERGLGRPPVPFCWLAMGSEGRREQTLKTDQDNALLYLDVPDQRAPETQRYFRLLASRVIEELVTIGFPACKGNVMASNPRWCQPLSVWKEYFATWIRESEPANLLNATIFFDFRPIWGERALAQQLKEYLNKDIASNKVFVGRLAKAALSLRPPLGLFKSIVVEKTGEHRGALDLKLRALMPLLDAIRVYGLEHAVDLTNTFERIAALQQVGVFSPDEASDIAGAYEFLMSLRIRHQLKRIGDGKPPDNFVSPDQLSKVDRNLLKGYLGVISNLQSCLESHFLTWFIS